MSNGSDSDPVDGDMGVAAPRTTDLAMDGADVMRTSSMDMASMARRIVPRCGARQRCLAVTEGVGGA